MPPLVKFRLVQPEDESRVFLDLVRKGRVISLKEKDSSVFIVPKKNICILDQAGVAYEVLEEMEAYGAVQALRSAITHQVQ